MKLQPNIGCAGGGNDHDYSFQTVYRADDHRGRDQIESVLGMCRKCGDIYMQPVTRMAQPREDRDDPQDSGLARPFLGGAGLTIIPAEDSAPTLSRRNPFASAARQETAAASWGFSTTTGNSSEG